MYREKTRTWMFVALTTTWLLLAASTGVLADEASGGLDDCSTAWGWFTSLQEWLVEALLDVVPDFDASTPESPTPEDQQCQEPEGCAETFPTTDPNG